MNYKVDFTPHYSSSKGNFINANNGYAQLISAIKRLERKVVNDQVIPRNSGKLRLNIYVEETHIKTPNLARLGCLTIINDAVQRTAPCMLFFVGEQAQSPPGQQTAACAAVLAVRGELGW